MVMENFRDLSRPTHDARAGFQFEFYCQVCNQAWRSPFKPYRTGQATALFSRLSHYVTAIQTLGRVGAGFSEVSSNRARKHALEEAQVEALKRFQQCASCSKWVSEECYDDREDQCVECSRRATQGASRGGHAEGTAGASGAGAAATVCPNCQTPSEGGRFCHECGFDMASTHKSCPGCGSTVARHARFCPDCGHGF